MRLSSYKLLKKSYSVRKLYDVFSNSPFVIVLHLDNAKNSNFKNLRKNLESKGVFLYLLNKDDFLNLSVGYVSRGSSILIYSSNYFFYPELKSFFESNNLNFSLLYFKYYYPLSGVFMDQFLNKYASSSLKVNSFFFFLLNSYKNLFFLQGSLLKKYHNALVNVFNYKVFQMFFILALIIDKKKNLKLENKNGNI